MEEDIKLNKKEIFEALYVLCTNNKKHTYGSIPYEKIFEQLVDYMEQLEKENQSYRDYLGEPPCYDNAKYIPKSRIQAKIEEFETQINNYEMIARYSKDIMQVRMMGEALGISRGFRDLLQELMEV